MSKYSKISDVIKDEIKNNTSLKKELISAHWKDIVGEALYKKSSIDRIKYRILFINVENSVWMQQMQFYKKTIISKINEFLNGKYVKDIKFKIGEKNIQENIENKTEKINQIDITDVILDSDEIFRIKKSLKNTKNEYKPELYKLISINKKREKKLLENDNIKCNKCGVIYPKYLVKCPVCKIKEKKQLDTKIFNEIQKKPTITFLELKEKYPLVKEKDVNIQKNRVKDRLLKKAKDYNNIDKEKMTECIYKYFMVETEISNKNLLRKKVNFFINELLKK